MQIKKLALVGAAAALAGGIGFGPNAIAEEEPTQVQCSQSQTIPSVDGLVTVHGEQPGSDGGGCLILEGDGGVPVNPVDDGYIGVHEDDGTGNPTLVGSCAPQADDSSDQYNAWDPVNGETDSASCTPGPA